MDVQKLTLVLLENFNCFFCEKGALDSQPHVIRFTSCLSIVGGSLRTPASSTNKTGRHDIPEILLKVALIHQK
jgi:hypothetical protein